MLPRGTDCLPFGATEALWLCSTALVFNCCDCMRRCCSPGGWDWSALALCSGDGASDRLAAIALGTACIAFAVVVFVFFTAWLLSPVRLWEAGQLNDEVVPRCWQYGCSRRLIALGQAPSFLAQCWSGHMYQLVCACFLGVVCLQVGSRARASWVSFVSISPNLARH